MAATYPGPVGAPKRQAQPGAEDALRRVVKHHEAMRKAEERRAEEAVARAVARARAIEEALALGLTLGVIGERLGVSVQRVAQMKEAK